MYNNYNEAMGINGHRLISDSQLTYSCVLPYTEQYQNLVS